MFSSSPKNQLNPFGFDGTTLASEVKLDGAASDSEVELDGTDSDATTNVNGIEWQIARYNRARITMELGSMVLLFLLLCFALKL